MRTATMAPKPSSNDYVQYEEILQSTRDDVGACHRDLAVDKFADVLLADAERAREFAQSHAANVAKKFDNQRSAETKGNQLSFDENTWWICGESERVQTKDMRTAHLDGWFTVQRQQYVAQMAAFVAKNTEYDRYRPVMVRLGCTLWEAKEYLENNEE